MTDDILQDLIKYLQKDFYLHTLKWSQIWRWLSPSCWKYSKIVPLGLGYIKWILSFREIPHPFPSPLFPPSTHITWPYLTSIIPRVPVLPRVNPPVLIIAFRKWVILLVQIYWSAQCSPASSHHGSSIYPSKLILFLLSSWNRELCHCHPWAQGWSTGDWLRGDTALGWAQTAFP